MSISVTNAINWQTTSEGARAMFQQECKAHERWYDTVANESDESLKDAFFDDDKEKYGKSYQV